MPRLPFKCFILASVFWSFVAECLITDPLDRIERSVRLVFEEWPLEQTNVKDLAENNRENFAVAKHLHERLGAFHKNGDCPRCWLQKAHCVCQKCPPLEDIPVNPEIENAPIVSPLKNGGIDQIFVLTHHKEICMVVDTAKLIAASFPISTHIVVGGIGPQFQRSMAEMQKCIRHNPSSCMVLFPSDEARTFAEITHSIERNEINAPESGWNIIILDGTWEQARKLYQRYICRERLGNKKNESLVHVKLSELSLVSILSNDQVDGDVASHSMQLRRHPEQWRQISTLAATRLLLTEMIPGERSLWDKLGDYQGIADKAARKQLGPVRLREINQ